MSHCEYKTTETAWCPGCGNFNILDALKKALEQTGKDPHEVLIVGGIGQAAKTPQYINANGFCGLHGRALPPAVAVKMVHPELTVVVNTGDGDTYGEGGNHFIHNIRRNVDIAHFVHNNQIYGLTKGQASPTTDPGHVTDIQTSGSYHEPLNPMLLAITMGAGFVARGFSGDKEHLTSLMAKAIQYRGYALVDILQPCVSFNKVNTFQWYNKRIYKLDASYDWTSKSQAIEKAMEWGDKIPVGILYQIEKETFHDKIAFLNHTPMVDQKPDMKKIEQYLKEFV